MDHVTVRFDDGSECKVLRAQPATLIPKHHGSLFPEEDQCPYYPGVQVRASSTFLFRNARWLRGSYKGKMEVN